MSGDHNMNQTDSGWRKRQIALDKKAENARELGLDYDIHSCSYYCDRPECIKAQRNELRDRLAQPEQDTIQRLSALVRAQQITIDKLEAKLKENT